MNIICFFLFVICNDLYVQDILFHIISPVTCVYWFCVCVCVWEILHFMFTCPHHKRFLFQFQINHWRTSYCLLINTLRSCANIVCLCVRSMIGNRDFLLSHTYTHTHTHTHTFQCSSKWKLIWVIRLFMF
jgi:hypothetical protein